MCCDLTIKNSNVQPHSIVPAAKIESLSSSNVLVGLQINPEVRIASCLVQAVLTFSITEMSGAGKVISEYTDNYQLEDFSIPYSDFFVAQQWYKRYAIQLIILS